jgi:hypothetical protein
LKATNVSCTIIVEVPVLTEYPSGGLYRDELIAWLHEHDFKPDDEIGMLARAVPMGCAMLPRKVGGWTFTRCEAPESLAAKCAANETVVGLSATHTWAFIEGDTPVVVRVRDILPEYEARST